MKLGDRAMLVGIRVAVVFYAVSALVSLYASIDLARHAQHQAKVYALALAALGASGLHTWYLKTMLEILREYRCVVK